MKSYILPRPKSKLEAINHRPRTGGKFAFLSIEPAPVLHCTLHAFYGHNIFSIKRRQQYNNLVYFSPQSSAMSLLSSFSVNAFNGLVSDYHDVRVYGDKKLPEMFPIIDKFGSVFIKHGKEKHASLCLSHRHFSLKEGEMKVARQNSDTVLSIKATSKDEIQELLQAHPGSKLIPYLFFPTKTCEGKASLIPLEYSFETKQSRISELDAGLEAVCDEEFLLDFLDTAAKHRVDGVYGISLHNRDGLQFDRATQATLEGSGDEDRTLVVKVVDKPDVEGEDVTTVAWSFSKDTATGKVVPAAACSSLRHGHPDGIVKLCYHFCNHYCVYGNH